MNLANWKRVRIAQWTRGRPNVRMRRLRRIPGRPVEREKEHYNLFDSLIGVTVPVPSKHGIIVLPLTYYSRNAWVPVDPGMYYYIVPERWLEYLGDAYDEEVLKVQRGLRAHGLHAPSPDTLLMDRVRERMRQGVDAVTKEVARTDAAKAKRRR